MKYRFLSQSVSGFDVVLRKVKQIFEVISALQHAVGQIFIIIRRNFHSTDNSPELCSHESFKCKDYG